MPAARAGVGVLGVAAVVLGALALRLWGFRHGLPLVYNADENAHFVAGAIGMFGHTYNPNYFINPPAYTYLLHVAFALGFGGRDGVSEAFAADPGDVFAVARALSARARRGRRRAAGVGGRAAVRPPRRPRRRGAAGGRLPARALRALRAQRRPDARARLPRARRHRRRLHARAHSATTRSPAPGSGSPARRSTPAGSCCCRCWRRSWPARACPTPGGSAASCSPACWRSRSSSPPTRSRCSTSRRSATGSPSSRRRRATAAASSA